MLTDARALWAVILAANGVESSARLATSVKWKARSKTYLTQNMCQILREKASTGGSKATSLSCPPAVKVHLQRLYPSV